MEERENRKLYQSMFHEIHASGELKRKVEAMGQNQLERRTKVRIRYAVALAAVLLLMFSNVIAYAATGRTWITALVLDGERTEVILEEHFEEDGTPYYIGRFPE